MMNHFEMMTSNAEQIVNGPVDREKSCRSSVTERC